MESRRRALMEVESEPQPSDRSHLILTAVALRTLTDAVRCDGDDDKALAKILVDAQRLASAIDEYTCGGEDDSDSDRTSLGGRESICSHFLDGSRTVQSPGSEADETPATELQRARSEPEPAVAIASEAEECPAETQGQAKVVATVALASPAAKVGFEKVSDTQVEAELVSSGTWPQKPTAVRDGEDSQYDAVARSQSRRTRKAAGHHKAALLEDSADGPATAAADDADAAERPAEPPAEPPAATGDATAEDVAALVAAMGMEAPLRDCRSALKRARGDLAQAVDFVVEMASAAQERKDAQAARGKRRRTTGAG